MKQNLLIACLCLLFATATATATASTPSNDNPTFARMVGHEGVVMLKNDKNTLPLKANTHVALFGINSVDYVKGGGGSGDVNVEYVRNLTQGLQDRQSVTQKPASTLQLYPKLVEFYQEAYTNSKYRNTKEPAVSAALMREARAYADVAILTIGRYSWEGADRKADKGDFYLSDSEQALINQVLTAGFKKVIAVLNIGGVIDTRWIKDDKRITAAILGWQAGMEGGNVLADIITGDAYPSGKLVDTFAKTYDDYPSSKTFNESRNYVNYEEDIFVGYRYFETIPNAKSTVNYEFGFGLGYATFNISKTQAALVGDSIVVSATIKNTGKRSGKEVVQLYFSAPQGLLGKPAMQLAAYIKTRELAPKATQAVRLSFAVSDMASYDDRDRVFPASYVLEKGTYTLHIGNSVRNTTKLTYQYVLHEDKQVKQLSHRATPTQSLRLLRANGQYENYTPLKSQSALLKSMDIDAVTLPVATRRLTFEDVKNNTVSMNLFVSTMNIDDLITLVAGRPNGKYSNTGGIGHVSSLNIPNALTADGPAGLRTALKATAWTCGTMQACTWNPDLIEQVGKHVADEAIAADISIWLAPGMNIHRDPLCGRNFEYYSEDPLISGKTAAALTRGVQSKGVSITLKHFACNNKEVNRNSSDSRLSERALREIYLRGFEIGVREGGAWSIMTSYNFINGTETSESEDLLTGILRQEWGYKGVVMTDWDNNSHHVKELLAGNDIKMPSGQPEQLRQALANGTLHRSVLEKAARNILSMILKTRAARQ